MIKINRERAEAVAMSRIRIERDKRLVELDVAFLRAVESGNDTAAIAAEKQALRDVTLQPDPLNIVWPTPPA